MIWIHALGRNLQRGSSGTSAGLLADLKALYRGMPDALQRIGPDEELRIPVDGGCWRGEIADSEFGVVALIRTFV